MNHGAAAAALFYAFFGPKDARNTHGKILVQEP